MKVFLSLGLVLSSLAFATDSKEVTSSVKPGNIRCPAIYDPAECSYLDLTASGTNSCLARLALNAAAAAEGIEIEPSKVVCQSGL